MSLSRREFVGSASVAAAAMALPAWGARTKDDAPIRVALIGCGGRGTGAAENCLKSAPNVELVALGDMFQDRLDTSRKVLAEINHPGFKVEDKRCFTGFDAYKRVLDSGVDYVLLATPPGFRPLHFAAAVETGKHVFMEKPVAVDPVGVRKVIAYGKKAQQKGLGVVAGTQYRHQVSFIETVKKLREGAIGDIVGGRAYFNTGTLWSRPREAGWTDMEWQLRDWYYFDWLSGDFIVEQHVHWIDVTNWAIGTHPVKAVATGGRQVRTEEVYGNIYDHFAVDYEFPNDVHVLSACRQMAGASNFRGAWFAGTKGRVDVLKAKIEGNVTWSYPGSSTIQQAYIQEHTDLIESVRAGKPINEAEQVAESSLTAILGREAAYTGKTITWDEMLNSDMDLSPPKYEYGPFPIRPVPMPGRERKT